MTVKLLSGGSANGISHVGSVDSFVFSLNMKRERKYLQDPHLPGENRVGPPAVARAHLLLKSLALAQLGLGSASLGIPVLARERRSLGSVGLLWSWRYCHRNSSGG